MQTPKFDCHWILKTNSILSNDVKSMKNNLPRKEIWFAVIYLGQNIAFRQSTFSENTFIKLHGWRHLTSLWIQPWFACVKDLMVETTSNIKQTSLKALLRDKLLSHVSMLGGTVGDGADGLLHSLKKSGSSPNFCYCCCYCWMLLGVFTLDTKKIC